MGGKKTGKRKLDDETEQKVTEDDTQSDDLGFSDHYIDDNDDSDEDLEEENETASSDNGENSSEEEESEQEYSNSDKSEDDESEQEYSGSDGSEAEEGKETEEEEESNRREKNDEPGVSKYKSRSGGLLLEKKKQVRKIGPATKSKNASTPAPVTSKKDEYEEYDTSDEEDVRNTVGNIPMNWYDEFKHLGYDWDGNKILKPETGDQLDEFLKRMEDPDFWRTVTDPQTGQKVILSDDDVNLIRRIKAQQIPDVTFDEYAPWIEWFTSEVMKMPLRKFPEHKRSFLPSRSEAKQVSKLVHALKMGWIKTRAEQERLRAKKEPQFYMIWNTDDQSDEMRRIHKHLPAPKRALPGHAESYNPPPEYLFDAKELKQWNNLKNAPLKRKLHFVPQKYDSLRKVPAYPRFIKERFLRCLDLYLCPRGIKMKLDIEPESLVPKLPSPRDLQPFPTTLAVEYVGHTDMVRTMSVDKSGQYLLTGSDDHTIKIWEVANGRCLKTIHTDNIVTSVEWTPSSALSLVLVATGNQVLLINPKLGDSLICSKTDEILKDPPKSDIIVNERLKTSVQWVTPDEEQYKKGYRMILNHFKEVKQVIFHGKGDYFASVMPEGLNRSVIISQISTRRSRIPFGKSKGLIQCVLFHPIKPILFVATQGHVRIYDLMQQTFMKRLMTNSQWISSMAIHSNGDDLLVGTYDRKVLWFDLNLSTKPYQALRLHGTAVRGVAFHKRYPLFASGSDDASLIVCHGMVYNDLLENALIVPLKRLHDHQMKNDYGIFAVQFHPLQPWVFSSGADGTVKLYSN